ncbi:alpha/beta hydrolase [Mycobacterium sp. D16R24]|uniref:alpha/beta hydrolase n=1 Tax=Mycobacterium sp. D16R24 TaxID=1855656 RepID=UPI000993C084|nr:alpha/beta hydrolase [Mycobacterium sp. D16R24]
MMNIAPISVDVGDIVLSGIYAKPENRPRALIVALHGGSVTSRIYDQHIPGDSSYLDLAAQLGFAAVAVDRPGYGASSGISPDKTCFDEQIAILRTAIADLWARIGGESAGVVLTGNSIGGMLALCLAAENCNFPLLGASAHSAGYNWIPGFATELQGRMDREASTHIDPRGRSTVVFGPEWTWPPQTAQSLLDGSAPAPVRELHDALQWPQRLDRIAGSISVPLRVAIAEYDDRWSSTPPDLRALQKLFTTAPLVEVHQQRFAGHQLGANYAARAFYLHELAFAEECRLAAITSAFSPLPHRPAS